MSRSMIDAYALPVNMPAADAVAGYLAAPDHGTGWPVTEWERAKAHSGALLPIYVAGPPWDAPDDATRIETQLGELGCPRGVAVVVDIEHYNALGASVCGYWPTVERFLNRLGYVPVVYCSRTDGHLFAGRRWLGDWTGVDHQAPGATITQWAAPGYGAPAGVDLSTIHDDTLPLWSAHGVPVPVPVPVPPPSTIPTPDWSMMAQTDTTKQLDGAGRGYFDLPNVTNAAIHAWGVIGVPDPALGWAPVTIPVVAFTRNHAGTVDRFVIMGGEPGQVVTVRVVHD